MPDDSIHDQSKREKTTGAAGKPIGPDHQLRAPDEPAAQHRSSTVKVVVWVVILLVFAVGIWLVLRQKNDQAAAGAGRRGAGGPVTVNVATAKKGDIGVYLDAIGTATPVYTASIQSQVNGVITAVHYREGQIVRKGEPLIEIDPRAYQATLLESQGVLERDQNVLAEAEMDLQRYKDAWSRNAIPKQTLDDQEKIVLQDQGTVKNDQGTVQYDQVQLSYCHIVSPITGRIGLRLVDPGNVVQSSGGTTLAVITQLQPMTVVFTLPEDDIGQVEAQMHGGAKLAVTAFDRGGTKQLAEGTLITLDNQVDTTTGTVKARATFANSDNALYPNQFVNTRLLVNTLHGVTLIPTSTIQHNGNDSFVYVIENNVAHQQSVTPGVVDGYTTQVTGIEPGNVVANSSFDKLQDKAKVVVSNKPVAANPSGSNAP